MSLTPEQIAAMVADADGSGRDGVEQLAGYLRAFEHVRALAAALELEQHRVSVQTSALQHHIKKWTEMRDKNFALEAELEALRKDRELLEHKIITCGVSTTSLDER